MAGGLGLLGAAKQVHLGQAHRQIVRIELQQSLHAFLGVGQAIGGDVQVDLGEVVADLVRRLAQQRRQGVARLVELALLGQAHGQAVADRVVVRVFLQLGSIALHQQAGGFLEIHLSPHLHQLEALAILDAALGKTLGTRLGIGDPAVGDRVGQQEFRRGTVIAILPGEPTEHLRHGARIVAGALQIDDADAVGLLLVESGKAQLALDGRRLGRGDCGDSRIAAACRGGHDAGEQGRHQRQLHALLVFHPAGEVALDEVTQLMGHDRRVFGFGLRLEEQPAIDPDHPAGRGEGVDLGILDQDEDQAVVLQVAGLGQLVDGLLDELLELRIVDGRDLAAQHAQPGAAHLKLLLGRDDRRAGIAQ